MLEDVRLLSAGFCLHPEAMTRRGASWKPCTFPSGFAVLQHARYGTMLFDTGYSERFAAETRTFPGVLYARVTPVHLGDFESARDQLAAAGIAAGDVCHVIVSHFHADHIAGLRDFPAARIICSRAAWESVRNAQGLAGLLKGFLPGLLPADIETRLSFVDDFPAAHLAGALGTLGQGRDLLGDGSVVAVDLPGHAAGHIGVFVQTRARGATLLVGDAAWSLQAIESLAPPPWVTTAFLGSTGAYRRTLQRLHAVRQALPHLPIVPSHCARTLRFTATG